jgi:hypothetical protein
MGANLLRINGSRRRMGGRRKPRNLWNRLLRVGQSGDRKTSGHNGKNEFSIHELLPYPGARCSRKLLPATDIALE